MPRYIKCSMCERPITTALGPTKAAPYLWIECAHCNVRKIWGLQDADATEIHKTITPIEVRQWNNYTAFLRRLGRKAITLPDKEEEYD